MASDAVVEQMFNETFDADAAIKIGRTEASKKLAKLGWASCTENCVKIEEGWLVTLPLWHPTLARQAIEPCRKKSAGRLKFDN
jgi:hypothetical protein